MKSLIAAAILTALLLAVPSFAAGPWTNEPAGSTQLLDWPFNSVESNVPFRTGIVWGNYGTGRITTDGSAPVSPSSVLVSSISPGANTGGSEIHYLFPQSYREMYVGLMWRTNPQFEGRPQGNKLFFMRGPNSNGVFNFNDGALVNGQGRMIWGANTGGTDNSHACSYEMGATCYPNISAGTLTRGAWTKLEAYVKASTTMTSRDGIVRWWINGVLAGNYPNLNYGSEGLNEWMWTETWDGNVKPVPTVEWDHYVDHLYISAPNCGPSGCVAPAYLVITSTLAPARTGIPYSATLTADGGTKPYTWFLTSGNLPAGLSLNQSTGVISGTPTCVGRSDFSIRVTDGSQHALTATKSYSVITSGSGICTSALRSNIGENGKAAVFMVKTASGKVTFNLPIANAAKYKVSIYDLTGKKVYEHRSLGQKEASIAKVLKNGVYLAKFVQGKQASTLKFQVMN